MKTAKIVTIMGLVAGVAGICVALALWMAHRRLITLHVRDVPLAKVARMIEDQAREKIRVDPKLAVNVTLDVRNATLTNVLDLLAEQVGARWGKTYAVYDSRAALDRLESVFAGSSTLAAEDWTNIAPRFVRPELPAIAGMPEGPGPHRLFLNGPGGSTNGNMVTIKGDGTQVVLPVKIKDGGIVQTEDVDTSGGPGGGVVVRKAGPGPGDDTVKNHVMLRVTRGPDGTTTTMTTMNGDGEQVTVMKADSRGEIVQEDHWSREQLVVETPMVDQLGANIPSQATRETAAAAASNVHGKFTTYYTMDKPPIGGDFRISPGLAGGPAAGLSTNPMSFIRAEQQSKTMGGLGKLTPEEQVQQARRNQESTGGSK